MKKFMIGFHSILCGVASFYTLSHHDFVNTIILIGIGILLAVKADES